MPFMEPFARLPSAAYEDEEEEDYDKEEEEEEEMEEDEDYSFSLSGFLEEDAFVDPAMLSRASEESISFTFSTENLLETRESGSFDFASALPLLKYAHACTLGSPPAAYGNFARLQSEEDHENAALVPFKISGSWRADTSFRHPTRHSESRRSFSFLTDLEDEEELAEESLIQVKDASIAKDLGNPQIHRDGEDHVSNVAATHNGDDEGKEHIYEGHSECDDDDDRDVPYKHANDEHDDGKLHNVLTRPQSTNKAKAGSAYLFDKFPHHDDNKHSGHGLLLPKQSNVESPLRFAGEGLLQPWSSSKLSKSVKRRANAERSNWPGIPPVSNHDATDILSHLHPLPYAPTGHNIKDDFDDKRRGMHPSGRVRSSESAVFSPSTKREIGSPTDAPICMPRKGSSLFARRMMKNTSETLSLLVHGQKPASTSFAEALPWPSSNGSANSSSYRTSSIGSTQSSGYSSSSGKFSTPGSSRNSSKNTLHVAARCSLQQRMDAEPFKLQDPTRGKQGDPSAQFHSKGDTQGNSYIHAQAAQSKVKIDPFAARHGVMSPSTSSPSPRSPLNWRSVISLQPLNPSHVPQDQWELLGKPSSRSHSQRSRSSSRGSSGKEGGSRNPSMSAATSQDVLLMHSNKRTSSLKGGARPTSTQKLVNTRGRYWGLNPMKWFKHCRNEKQVVDTATNIIEERPPSLL